MQQLSRALAYQIGELAAKAGTGWPVGVDYLSVSVEDEDQFGNRIQRLNQYLVVQELLTGVLELLRVRTLRRSEVSLRRQQHRSPYRQKLTGL
jgi:hypothetical protein